MRAKNLEDIEYNYYNHRVKNKEIRDLTTEIYKQTLHIQELEKLLE